MKISLAPNLLIVFTLISTPSITKVQFETSGEMHPLSAYRH